MHNTIYCSTMLLVLLVVGQYCIADEEVKGCNGMIKSDYKIDLTFLKVYLYSSDGIVRYVTECAPNDGYFFLLFNEFINKPQTIKIRLEVPNGWTFNTLEENINLNFEDDICTLGYDVIFEFVGFKVEGRIISYSLETGPEDVKIKLTNGLQIVERQTGVTGDYTFEGVPPGTYNLSASHDEFNISQDVISVVVTTRGNTIITQTLVVFGYNIQGYVTHEETPIKGVYLILSKVTEQDPKIEIMDEECYKIASLLPQDVVIRLIPETAKVTCVVKSDERGEYVFSSIAPGDYVITAYHSNLDTEFSIEPNNIDISILHSNAIVKHDFNVMGFTVRGYVVRPDNNNNNNNNNKIPMTGVNIEIYRGRDKFDKSISDENGAYQFSNIKLGNYEIRVNFPGYQFEMKNVTLSPTQTKIVTIEPLAYEIDVKIKLLKFLFQQEDIKNNLLINIYLKNSDKLVQEVYFNDELYLTTYLALGTYLIKPQISGDLHTNGLRLTPSVQQLAILGMPIYGIEFIQILASLEIGIECIQKCQHGYASVTEKFGSFNKISLEFPLSSDVMIATNLLPGMYTIEINEEICCWQQIMAEVIIGSEGERPRVTFKQTGFVLDLILSHNSQVLIKHNQLNYTIEEHFALGTKRICAPHPGKYDVIANSCHRFEPEDSYFDTESNRKLVLTANQHLAIAKIIVSNEDFEVGRETKLQINLNEKGIVLLEPISFESITNTEQNEFELIYEIYVSQNEKLNLEPKSEKLLFIPKASTYTVTSTECPIPLPTFSANKGVIISGRIIPPTQGVQIQLKSPNLEEMLTTTTDHNGEYLFGPLSSLSIYEITPTLTGYIFEQLDNNYDFNVKRIGSLSITVYDEMGKPLIGVLVSTHCGKTRMNNLTSSEGTLNHLSIMPGEYYVKPSLKEYTFTPIGEMVIINYSDDVIVNFIGKKTEYSCYGRILSLNGYPEINIQVVARGIDICSDVEEKGVSGVDGVFRIPGLRPKCSYKIYVKTEISPFIENVIPNYIIDAVGNEDILNIDFKIYNRTVEHELSGRVIIDNDDYLQYLHVKLYEDTAKGRYHIRNIPIDQSGYFEFTISRADTNKQFILKGDHKNNIINNILFKSEEAYINLLNGDRHYDVIVNFEKITKLEESPKLTSYLGITLVLIGLVYATQFSAKIRDFIKKFI